MLETYKKIFFIGIAGVGMSAIAQYLKGIGKEVSGSDRYFVPNTDNKIRTKLEAEGIQCFLQDGSGIDAQTDLVVVSTAIEETVAEVQKAKSLNIDILKRSQVLSLISDSKRTIAVGGTSGKSTTSAMIFHILEHAGLDASIISGAGLTSIIKQGKIGNAKVGQGEWLVIEADESDGSIVQYKPEIGVLLNIEKDHQEIEELMQIFGTFKTNSQNIFICNQSNHLAAKLSVDARNDFSVDAQASCGFVGKEFEQKGFNIHFKVNEQSFELSTVGKHNMENALAAVAACSFVGVGVAMCAEALHNYEGIYRRHQIVGQTKGILLIDDYAHNPAKCAAAISACQPLSHKVIAWFQPHGYKPTKFLRHDFVKEIAATLRSDDEIWMSEIFYAGGTATKDISASELIAELQQLGKKAYFVENRNDLITQVRPSLSPGTVLLLMGARDPSLEHFAQQVFEEI